jgi:hypothetical protein
MNMNLAKPKLLIALLVLTVFSACESEATKTEKKNLLVGEHQTEIKLLLDSVSVYLDSALILADNKIDTVGLNTRILPTIESFRKKISAANKEFLAEAAETRITDHELNEILFKFNEYMAPMEEKIKKLHEKGVNL